MHVCNFICNFAPDYKQPTPHLRGQILINFLGISIMLTAKIGENAGLVWNALQGGALSTDALKKATKLKVADLNFALGWLAREGKIAFEVNEKETIISLI